MSLQLELDCPYRFTITLEIVPEDPLDADSAMVDSLGRDTADALRTKGYEVKPIYTGQRGGFLVDVILPFLTIVWAQKDIILADGSALVTILTPVILIINHLREAHEKRAGRNAAQQQPIKITLEIDGTPIRVEVADVERAEDVLKLAQRIQANNTTLAAKVKPQSKVKVIGSVPKKQPRKRR